MIIQIRVDDRLIHGQIALVWSKALQTNRIVVANNEAAANETVKMSLSMAVPNGIKLLIRSIDDSISLFNNPKSAEVPLFVLTKNVKDALTIAKSCPGKITAVNIANVGKFDGVPMDQKLQIMDGFFTKDEIDAAEQLTQIEGLDVFHQITPERVKESVAKILKEQHK